MSEGNSLKLALVYAGLGLQVFPLRAREKIPLPGSSGFKDATLDPAALRRWWGNGSEHGIAVATGTRSRVAVLDVDPRNGGAASLERLLALHGPLPTTPTVATGGGGTHYYFRSPEPLAGRVLADGLDLKADGGYVVAPFSIHPSGGRYVWTTPPDSMPFAELPASWAEFVASRPAAPAEVLPGLIGEGSRNNTMTSLAGSMHRRAMTPAAILSALRAENAARCVPPLPDHELEAIVEGLATRYEPGAPLRTTPRRPDPPKKINFEELFTVPEVPIPWVIKDWLASGDIAVVAAEGGMGKSFLSMELALSLATGTPFLGHLPVLGGPSRVLVIDEENAPRLARHRLRQLIRGRGLETSRPLEMEYLCQNAFNFDDRASKAVMLEEIETYRPAWVILDAMIRFHHGDENSNSEMAAFFNRHLKPLRGAYDCGFVVLHHMSKPQDGKELIHRVRGAAEVVNMADQAWSMTGDRHSADRLLQIEKSRWRGGALPAALSLSYQETPDGEEAILLATEATVETRKVILDLLASYGHEGALRQDLAATLTTLSETAFRYALGRLHSQGQIRRRADGRQARYWMVAYAPADAD